MKASIIDITQFHDLESTLGPASEDLIDALSELKVPVFSFVNGEYDDSSTEEFVALRVSPITDREVYKYHFANDNTIEESIVSSENAFKDPNWKKITPRKRGDLLKGLAKKISEHAEQLALFESLDTGKPFSGALYVDVAEAANTFRWYGELCDKVGGETAPKGTFEILANEPMGPIACITPFNYPLMIAAWKIAPMLAAGNTVILKPSEKTTSTSLLLAELAISAGFPAGVLNVVIGGPDVAKSLAADKRTEAVGFTGSSAVGLQLMQEGNSKRLKSVYIEAGGKSPAILTESANVTDAADAIAGGAFYMAGQSCNAPTRVIVHESKLDLFVEKMQQKVEAYKPANPLRRDEYVGALISKEKYESIQKIVEEDMRNGGKYLCGELFCDIKPGLGAYVEPACYMPSSNDSEIVQTELFVPLITIQTYSDIEDALKLANSTKYGLWASAWTNDIKEMKFITENVFAGTVAINDQFAGDISTPMGGYGGAGLGKDRGILAMKKYLNVKHISIK